MIELLFAACMSGAPDQCKDRSIWFIDQTPQECRESADRQLEKWLTVNPKWEIGAWSCAQVDNRAATLVE